MKAFNPVNHNHYLFRKRKFLPCLTLLHPTDKNYQFTYEFSRFRHITFRLACMQQTHRHACIDFFTYSDDHLSRQSGLCPNREPGRRRGYKWTYRSLPIITDHFSIDWPTPQLKCLWAWEGYLGYQVSLPLYFSPATSKFLQADTQ